MTTYRSKLGEHMTPEQLEKIAERLLANVVASIHYVKVNEGLYMTEEKEILHRLAARLVTHAGTVGKGD